jgi:hypothetical protein
MSDNQLAPADQVSAAAITPQAENPIKNAKIKYAAYKEATGAQEKTGTDELRAAMAFGDALISLGEAAPKRKKFAYIHSHFDDLPRSTLNLCMKLARGREIIDADLSNGVRHSIRTARTRLRKPAEDGGSAKAKAEKPAKEKPATDLMALTSEQRKAAFAACDIHKIIQDFPVAWFSVLRGRFERQTNLLNARKKARHGDDSYNVIEGVAA